MFTGIIEKTTHVIAVADAPMFRRLTLASNWADVRNGESIAVNGVCLTVAEIIFDLAWAVSGWNRIFQGQTQMPGSICGFKETVEEIPAI